MSQRIYNFAPGPAVLPEPVLRRAQADLLSLGDTGIGVLEHSHRGGAFRRVLEETEADARALLGVPDDYRVLFLQGGASTQFYMVPANFLAADGCADYLDTGSWSRKAIAEARLYGGVHVAASSQDAGYSYVPDAAETRWSERPVYAHFTANNTIYGTQWRSRPAPPEGAFLVCDASSDLFSRPIDVSRYGLLYACAQKNFGAAGLTLVILRDDLLDRSARELPSMLRYRLHADNQSCYNTPNTFGVYLMGGVLRWIRDAGGLAAMAKRAEERARLLYDAIDASRIFRGTARADCRSLMNVTFRAASEAQEERFLAGAAERGLAGLKGHRSVGGMRASLYNAFPLDGCRALVAWMREFEQAEER